jgi:hypothetical protein
MATAGSDCVLKIWQLPEAGDEPLTSLGESDACATLRSHRHCVRTVNFHPTVPNLLASTSQDMTLKLFDVNTSADVVSINLCGGDSAISANASFNLDGSVICVASKDRMLRLYDVRSANVVLTTPDPSGGSSTPLGRNLQAVWCGNPTNNMSSILSVSSAISGMRTLHMWDPRFMTDPMCTRTIDNAPGQLFPLFDESSSVCIVAGKGDTLVRYYECSFLNETSDTFGATCERGTDFQSNSREPIAGICLMQKRACNVMNVEVAKLLKLTVDAVIPITFTVPRAEPLKAYFQDDVFGPVRSKLSSYSVADWLSGGHHELSLESLKPEGIQNLSEKPVEAPVTPSSMLKKETIQKEAEERTIRNEAFAKVMTKAAGKTVGAKSYKVDAKLVDEDSDDNNWDDY